MAFITVRIEGSIFTADILDKIAASDIKGQNTIDFGFKAGIKVKDEIALAWADAQSVWQVFKRQFQRLGEGDSGTSETRKYWIIPLLGLLGYDAQYIGKAEIIDNQTYDISHRAVNRGGFPIHIMGIQDSLEKKRETSGPRLSPHALMQEYLNLTEHMYGIVTNGSSLRLLRDSSRLVKLSYIEFDLYSMMEESHFADFALLFRFLHVSRIPLNPASGPESLCEFYHQESIDSGSRIRERLSKAVSDSITSLAEGFLNFHPAPSLNIPSLANDLLRHQIDSKELAEADFYQHLLRLIYRLLFLMVIEERNLIFDSSVENRYKDIYKNYYSVSQLRKRCESLPGMGGQYVDLWITLTHTFRLFEDEEKGRVLGIKPLSGLLFAPDAIGILNKCQLSNQVLLNAIENLSLFHLKSTGQKTRVNYGSLNVEEFGSVYEGMLEYTPVVKKYYSQYSFSFKAGMERSISGSHYTPDELVKPLIQHSLEYIITEKIKQNTQKADKVAALLSIKVCDATCGSGHILLSAARRIGVEVAKIRTGEDQPSPMAQREGTRDAIFHCIYGVDKNPLAVELCKVALWIEAHTPGQPLNFLDHRIKCGDAIVGLAHQEELHQELPDSAFTPFGNDNKQLAADLKKLNKKQRLGDFAPLNFTGLIREPMNSITAQYKEFAAMTENSVAQIEAKKQMYLRLIEGGLWLKLKSLADLKTAQFFIPKTPEKTNALITHGLFRQYLSGMERQDEALPHYPYYQELAQHRFFHWFLEFPEVFADGGFDCILGNPPFLGGLKISTHYGSQYLNYLHEFYAPAGGTCDLVAYFFRRIFTLLKPNGFQSLIATNTIAQGATREGGLEYICGNGGIITHAVRSMRWPGIAAVEVALVTIYKGKWEKELILNQKMVKTISYYLDEQESIKNPFTLLQNAGKSFVGSYVLGKGFILTNEEVQLLIERNRKNKDVIFPYLNGDDLNSRPDQSPSRWVINFFNWSEEKCKTEYPNCFEIVEQLVKPEREKLNIKFRREKWWQFACPTMNLYNTIKPIPQVIAIAEVTKYCMFSFVLKEIVYMHTLKLITSDSSVIYSVLNSSIHEYWAWKYSSTMGGVGLRYTPSSAFETFPFPQNMSVEQEAELERVGEVYHEFRRQLLLDLQLGLTKTYNQFHNRQLAVIESPGLSPSELEKQYGKETLNLWVHLSNTPGTCSYNDAVAALFKLRHLHQQIDQAVLNAYGWSDIQLAHDFYEIEYLPENDRVRFTISPVARKEILHRLLLLNHHIHQQEQSQTSTLPKTKQKTSTKNSQDDTAKQKSLF